MNSKADNFLDIISELDETELNSLIDKLDINKACENEPSKENLENIKMKTYYKTNQNPNNKILRIKDKKKRFFSSKRIIASAAVLTLLVLPFSGSVIADIKSILKYIPGNNEVVESKTSDDIFVLKKPIKVYTEKGYVELTALVIDNNKNIVSIAARGEEKNNPKNHPTKIKTNIKFKNEKIIKLTQGGYSEGCDNNKLHWNMQFSHHGNKLRESLDYKEGDILNANIELENVSKLTIKAKLEKAKSYEAYKELGPTVDKNDLSLTAIPMWYDNKLKINILGSNKNENTTNAYKLEYKYIENINFPITLIDKNNNIYNSNINKNLAPYALAPYELEFDIKNTFKENNLYKLNIPYIIANYCNKNYQNTITHKIKLPKIGETLNFRNESITLGKFKLQLLSAERKSNDEVIINVATGYSESALEYLYNVNLNFYDTSIFKKCNYTGYTSSYFDDSQRGPVGPLHRWIMKLSHSDSSELALTIDSFQTVKKGPWIIDIPSNIIKK